MAAASLIVEFEHLRNETHADLLRLERATATTFTLMCVFFLFLMQAGFAMLEAGSVRDRSVRDVLFKNLLDISVGGIAWFLLGYLFYSDSGNAFIGMPTVSDPDVDTPFALIQAAHKELHGEEVAQCAWPMTHRIAHAASRMPHNTLAAHKSFANGPRADLMSFMFAATSATIVSGAIAERTQQRAYIISSSIMVGLVRLRLPAANIFILASHIL